MHSGSRGNRSANKAQDPQQCLVACPDLAQLLNDGSCLQKPGQPSEPRELRLPCNHPGCEASCEVQVPHASFTAALALHDPSRPGKIQETEKGGDERETERDKERWNQRAGCRATGNRGGREANDSERERERTKRNTNKRVVNLKTTTTHLEDRGDPLEAASWHALGFLGFMSRLSASKHSLRTSPDITPPRHISQHIICTLPLSRIENEAQAFLLMITHRVDQQRRLAK